MYNMYKYVNTISEELLLDKYLGLLRKQIQKTKIMASGPITSWQIDGKQWTQWLTLFFWAPKSLQMVTAAIKLKDICSLEGKL